LKPFTGVTVNVKLALPPRVIVALAGEAETEKSGAPTPPLPVKVTACRLFGAFRWLSVNTRVALRGPPAEGVNVTVSRQNWPPGRVVGKGVHAACGVNEKSPALGPETAALLMISPPVPVFVMVTFKGVLVANP
jgi:hypothetical protein